MNKTLLVLVRCVKGIEKLAFQFLLALCTDFFCLNKLHNGRSTLAHETRIKESGHADEREHTRERTPLGDDFLCFNKLLRGRSTLTHKKCAKVSEHAGERENTRERENSFCPTRV